MKFLLGVLIGILAIVAVLVLVAGYLGFVPGVSSLFGSDKPVDLGTTYTAQDYSSAIAKSGIQFQDNTDELSLPKTQKTYGPAKPITVDFTPAEVLAVLNEKAHDPDFPVKDWQLRINSDGTAEVAAVVLIDKLSAYSTSHGVSSEGVRQVLDQVKKLGIIQKEVPVYMKGTAIISGGKLDFNVITVKVGRLSISAGTINQHKVEIIDFYNTHKNDVPGLQINNASIVNGKFHFDGTVPSSVKRKS